MTPRKIRPLVHLEADGLHIPIDGQDVVVRTIDEWHALTLPNGYRATATLDFPRRCTDDPELIALCRYVSNLYHFPEAPAGDELH
jgi:hypothetical protein